MTQLDEDEALILARARRALSPTNADEQRVLQSLLPQMDLPSGSQSPGTSWPLRGVGAIAVMGAVALSGGLGYRKGVEVGIAQQERASTTANVGAVVPAPATASQPERRPSVEPAHHSSREREGTAVASAPSARRAFSAASVGRVSGETPAAPAALGLDEEVRQLRRVERAIRESRPRFALALLEDLDSVLPAGQLMEERQAARIMANCQLAADGAVAHARAFAAKHRGSAYLARVFEICGIEGASPTKAAGHK